jgi:type I restriction enzyme S subunit
MKSNWLEVPLTDVCSLITDGTHHSPLNTRAGKFKYVTAKNIRPWGLDLTDMTFVDADTHAGIYARCPVAYGDVLYIKDGVTTGIAAINTLEEPFSMLSSVALLKPIHHALDSRYLKHWLNSPVAYKKMTGEMTGTAIKRLVLRQIRSSLIELSPLPEQKRIADKLDTVLARVDACRERLNRVPLILKRFRQSVLAAATSGKLTEDWRVDHATAVEEVAGDLPAQSNLQTLKSPLLFHERDQESLISGWRWQKLVKLAELESGHTPRKSVPAYWETGDVPWISLQDIRAADGKELFETKYMPTVLGIKNSSARLLPKGTVCFCRDISFGYVTMMGREMSTTQHFANWVCGNALNPKFLMYAFMAGRDFLSMSGQGTTVKTIYMPALKELRLATPPIVEQHEIVRRVETLFAFADRLEARLATARAATERLTPALLAKAFRGELVPQDPNDEPASALLQRLAASRAASSAKPARARAANG